MSFNITGSVNVTPDILLSTDTISNNNAGNLNLEVPSGQAVNIVINGIDELQVDGSTVTLPTNDLIVGGNLTIQGTTTAVNTENLNILDTHIYLSKGYTTAVGRTCGFIMNYLPTATTDSVAVGGFTAGVTSTTDHQVATTSAGNFAANDIVQISDANNETNNGLFEVESHAGNVLVCRGIGLNPVTHTLFQDDFVTDTTVQGTITKVTINVLQTSAAGIMEIASGSVTPLVFATLSTTVAAFEFASGSLNNVRQVGEAALLDAVNDGNILGGGGVAALLTDGDYNVVFGQDAFSGVTSGPSSNNIVLGQNALVGGAGTTADHTVAIGTSSANSLSTGIANVLIGRNSGSSLTTGGYNVAMGDNVLSSATISATNVAIGQNAMSGITSNASDGNVAIGYASMTGSATTTTDNSVAIGSSALVSITTGTASVAIGNTALLNATTADRSIAIGNAAMGSGIVTGPDNIAIGSSAASALTSGTLNVAIGANSLDASTVDTHNVAIGQNAMGSVSGAGPSNYNVAIGSGALLGGATTTSDNTVAIGTSSGAALTTGTASIAIGNTALTAATSGSRSIAIGNAAMGSGICTGDDNIAIGTSSGDAFTSAYNCVAIGTNAMDETTTGPRNIAIGQNAMGAGICTGDDNTCIGTTTGQQVRVRERGLKSFEQLKTQKQQVDKWSK
jgi:hypothetical protein